MPKSTSLAWLIGNEGTPDEVRYPLNPSETILGRGGDCDIQVDDQLVSRRHAAIQVQGDHIEVKDLDSSNGTFLNEKEVSRSPIKDGDRIRMGNTTFLLQMEQDPDATIIQPREPEDTVVAIRQTVPHKIGAVECRECGEQNPQSGTVCYYCGSILPQLPLDFQKTLDVFQKTQRSHQKGKLSDEKYHAAMAELMIQDQSGTYWMLGLESGDWYWFDGEDWLGGDPPLIIPGEEIEPEPPAPIPMDHEIEEYSAPRTSPRSRWGTLVLWVISALVVLALGVYSVSEIIRFSRGYPASYSDPSGYTEDDPVDPDLSEDSGDSVLPGADTATETNEGSIRPYDPTADASLTSLTAEAVYQEESSSDLYSIYQGNFTSGRAAILVMNWCAVDQNTLVNNMSSIYMEAALDGSVIPQETWTVEDSQIEGMFCRIYRSVAKNLRPGLHQYLWTTSYDVPINDGWETYPPGTYLNEFNISIPGSDQTTEGDYTYSDDFQIDEGHWGGLDLEEVQIWVEGGGLHIKLNQAGISGITHFQDRIFDDFSLVTTSNSLGDPSGMYGVVFRYQDDQNYYSFQITELGLFRLVKVQGDTVELITWTESDAIDNQGGKNQFAVSMQGDHILASINGQGVADLRDPTFVEGDLSLIAGSLVTEEQYHAVFDQVSIEAPE